MKRTFAMATILVAAVLVGAQHAAPLQPRLLVEPAQTISPDWCKALPRPEYKALEHVQVSDAWFEVYKVAPNVFAIYEPHQSEEAISYLIAGDRSAILFDTGMGIS